MGTIKSITTAHPFFALMFSERELYDLAINRIREKYGEIMGVGPIFKVSDFTDYYEKEFGKDLQKQFFVMKEPVDLQNFARVKIWSNELETETAKSDSGRLVRTIDLDPGYLEPSKLVLYSTKNFSHRVFVTDGIFGEVTMIYEHGKFKFLPWTYPDYSSDENVKFLMVMRDGIVRAGRNQLRKGLSNRL